MTAETPSAGLRERRGITQVARDDLHAERSQRLDLGGIGRGPDERPGRDSPGGEPAADLSADHAGCSSDEDHGGPPVPLARDALRGEVVHEELAADGPRADRWVEAAAVDGEVPDQRDGLLRHAPICPYSPGWLNSHFVVATPVSLRRAPSEATSDQTMPASRTVENWGVPNSAGPA